MELRKTVDGLKYIIIKSNGCRAYGIPCIFNDLPSLPDCQEQQKARGMPNCLVETGDDVVFIRDTPANRLVITRERMLGNAPDED